MERWTLVLRWVDTVREYTTKHPHECHTVKGEEEWVDEKPESAEWAQQSTAWGAIRSGLKRNRPVGDRT